MVDALSEYFMQGVDHLYLVFPSLQCILTHIALRYHMDQIAKLMENKYSSTRQKIMKIYMIGPLFLNKPFLSKGTLVAGGIVEYLVVCASYPAPCRSREVNIILLSLPYLVSWLKF
jgi:hypothetical protein